MRISSKFRDYYDFVADQFGGGDPRVTYARTRLTKMDPKNPEAGEIIVEVPHWGELPEPNHRGYFNRNDWWEFRYLIVVGRAYLLARPNTFLYNGDINSFQITDPPQDRKYSTYWRRDSFEFGVEHEFLVELSRAVKHPVFVINKLEWRKQGKTLVHVDGQCPVLGRMGMAKRIDPYQMYQELAMFVGNKMRETPDTKPPVELDNKQKIVKAGFDLKKSFRHRV